jgi:uncharacterized protein YwgA
MTRSEILMQLLGAAGHAGPSTPIVGTTKLQKLLFLIEREEGICATEGDDFDFTAYKFGPVSKELYDDLGKLENLGYIVSQSVAEPSNVERDEYGLSFEGLMGDEESTEAFEEKQYSLTEKGKQWLQARNSQPAEVAKIEKVKGRYGSLSLSDLLRYVYSRYPDMTTASEIREKVLGVN